MLQNPTAAAEVDACGIGISCVVFSRLSLVPLEDVDENGLQDDLRFLRQEYQRLLQVQNARHHGVPTFRGVALHHLDVGLHPLHFLPRPDIHERSCGCGGYINYGGNKTKKSRDLNYDSPLLGLY